MNLPLPGCRACFPHGERPQCQTYAMTLDAMKRFSVLFDAGKMPVMCQSTDGSYRVCFQTAATAAATSRHETRREEVALEAA